MSVRSGVFTKYVLEFPGQKLKISNDPASGDLVLDSDVTVTMARGTAGSTFKIQIYELPKDTLKTLKDAVKDPLATNHSVNIQLGYFDTAVDTVLESGVFGNVSAAAGASPNDGKLVTTINGKEGALFAASETTHAASVPSDKASSFADVAQEVLNTVFTTDGKTANPGVDAVVTQAVQSDAKPTGPSKSEVSFPKGGTVLTALAQVASMAKQELLLVDKAVILGLQILLNPTVQLDPQVNLAQFEELNLSIRPRRTGKTPPDPVTVKGFSFTALGDPTMRPGQTVVVSGIDALKSPPTFVIRNVEHQFNSTKGYTCVGAAAEVLKDGSLAVALDAAIKSSAASAAQGVAGQISAAGAKNPAIEVVSVKQAGRDAFRADLYYSSQDDNDPEPQPSVNIVVEEVDKQVYENKPIASPFAWRKCGLVTPLYPGMKALLAHNVGLPTDGIVTGYIWSAQPDAPPPPNKTGDWWLCLPIDFAGDKPPDDGTKAVNDLTSATGHRVIEAKGLKITIGASKLGTVGARPSEGGDDEFLIEHASGASLHIDSQGALTIVSKGAMSIDASSASLSIKGKVTIQGSLEIE